MFSGLGRALGIMLFFIPQSVELGGRVKRHLMAISSNYPSFEILKPRYWRSNDSCWIGQHSRAILTDSRSPRSFFSDTLLLRWKYDTWLFLLIMEREVQRGTGDNFQGFECFSFRYSFSCWHFQVPAWAFCRIQDDKTIQLLFSPHPRLFSLQNWGVWETLSLLISAWERIGSRWPRGRVRS